MHEEDIYAADSPDYAPEAVTNLQDEFRISEEDEGRRFDSFLAGKYTDISRGYIQRCISDGYINLNGQCTNPSKRLKKDDCITVNMPAPSPAIPRPEPEQIPLAILYEDAAILVLNKQPGIVVHPTANATKNTLVHGLLAHAPDSFEPLLDPDYRPGIVHRLDKDTSGALIVAKTSDGTTRLKEAFKQRLVDKTYLALVRGIPSETYGEVYTEIGRNPGNRKKMAVVSENGKPADTRFRVLESVSDYSLLQVEIQTGRTHQIRVHLAHLGCPVLGDALYGGKHGSRDKTAPRQMLHQWKLACPHPENGVTREYCAPLPDDFRTTLYNLDFTSFSTEKNASKT